MVMENDVFRVPEKYMNMSITELEKAKEKEYREFRERPESEKKTKRQTKPCSVVFNI